MACYDCLQRAAHPSMVGMAHMELAFLLEIFRAPPYSHSSHPLYERHGLGARCRLRCKCGVSSDGASLDALARSWR